MGAIQNTLLGVVGAAAAGAALTSDTIKGAKETKAASQKSLQAKQTASNDLQLAALKQQGLTDQSAAAFMEAEKTGSKAKGLRDKQGRFASHSAIKASLANNNAYQNIMSRIQQEQGFAERLNMINQNKQTSEDLKKIYGGKK